MKLTKLAEWWKNFVHETKKSEFERYLENSKDIFDLESRVATYYRQPSNWSGCRYP